MLLTKAFSSGTLSKQQVYVHGEDDFLDAEEAWLHDEASEEGGQACSDAELIASQRRIIIDVGKQLGRKIMAGNLNLINITLPVVMFEPRSYLQKLADPWVHPVHLEAAAATPCPLERLKLCVAWLVAGLQHVFSGWRKPFNPVLGETWQACLPSGSTICCEQISHHPPVTAFHLEGPCSVFKFDGLSQPEVSFAGGGLRTSARGYRRITFASDGSVIAITYPYYRIGGLLGGVPHGLIKGTATLTDTKHNLTATVRFGPVAGATSRLLSRADSFEVIITGPASAAGFSDDVSNVIAVPAWVKQVVAEVAARRAGCHGAAAVSAAAAAVPVLSATSDLTEIEAAAATATATLNDDVSAHNVHQRKEAEKLLGPIVTALTSSSSSSQVAYQPAAGAAAAAAAAAATQEGPTSTEDSLPVSLLSSRLAKQMSLRRSKSDADDVGTTAQTAATSRSMQQQQQQQQQQQVYGCSSCKDGYGGSSSSKNGRRLAQFFVRASSTALRISSGSSTTCSSNNSSTQSLVKMDHSSSTGKTTSSSSGGSKSLPKNFIQSTGSDSSRTVAGKRNGSGRGSRLYRVLGPVACFMSPATNSRDTSEHSGTICSSVASSMSSSRGPGAVYCSTTIAAAGEGAEAVDCQPVLAEHGKAAAVGAGEAAAADAASPFEAVSSSSGGSSSHCVQFKVTSATAASEDAGEAAEFTDATRNAEVAISVEALSGASCDSSSSSSKPWAMLPMQLPQQQQQQQREQVAIASPVHRSSLSLSCKQQQHIHHHENSSALGSGVHVLALGTGCWLSHLDFDGQRYWTLVDDQPEVWQPQQQQQCQLTPPPPQQQYVLPSDCQNRPDLVALREGDVKLSQQLKEQMEQQQRRDAKMRPSFPHVDCSA